MLVGLAPALPLPVSLSTMTLRCYWLRVTASGDVAHVKISQHDDGSSKGWGIVEMVNPKEARAAMGAHVPTAAVAAAQPPSHCQL